MGRGIGESVRRRLYAESMGRCMNPDCKEELFKENGDIIEKAHIIPYSDTRENSYENLIILCPNCHTNFDKNHAYSVEEIKMWKQIRNEEFEKFFCEKYDTFNEMRRNVAPLLLENKTIYENYYLTENKELWDNFEGKILANNGMLRRILENNLGLIHKHNDKSYSNLDLVHSFLLHIKEFEDTRLSEEKNRHVLFPEKINSIFGVSPINDRVLPSVESLEALIIEFQKNGQFENLVLGDDNPYLMINEDGMKVKIFLNDTPRLRQLYYDFNCYRKVGVRLESLNYALKYIKSRRRKIKILSYSNLKEVLVNNKKIIFVYEYCLSKIQLMRLAPEENCVIVNLHNWNGESCISNEAYDFAKTIEVSLLTMKGFYGYINKI